MTREQMMDLVAKRVGLENKWTIWFFQLAENRTVNTDILALAMANVFMMLEWEEEKEEEFF